MILHPCHMVTTFQNGFCIQEDPKIISFFNDTNNTKCVFVQFKTTSDRDSFEYFHYDNIAPTDFSFIKRPTEDILGNIEITSYNCETHNGHKISVPIGTEISLSKIKRDGLPVMFDSRDGVG